MLCWLYRGIKVVATMQRFLDLNLETWTFKVEHTYSLKTSPSLMDMGEIVGR